MKQPILPSVLLALVAAILFSAPAVQAQAPFVIPIQIEDDSLNARTLGLGVLFMANLCIDTTDQYGGYQEFELPPVPPTNVFDARFADPTFASGTCYGEGSLVDIRPVITFGAQDTFLVTLQEGTGGYPIHVSWPAGLSSNATEMRMVDAFTLGSLFDIDMLTATNYDVQPGHVSFVILIKPIAIPPISYRYVTLTPDDVFDENPAKPGKSNKAVKRGKNLIPNWTNLLQEVVLQGGFQPGTSESDIAGGMVVGTSHMFDAGGKYKPVKDSAAVRYWLRFTKWDPVKGGKKEADLQKTLQDKTGKHIGIARGFDMTGNPGDIKRKPLLKEKKKHTPKIQSNRLFAELLALKVNIASSALEKTPVGFGDLVYDNDGHVFDEMSLTEIADYIDHKMTYWYEISADGGAAWDAMHSALYDINRAFPAAPTDTVSFEIPAKLELFGTVDLTSVTFLKSPTPFVPTRVTPANNFTEPSDDWEDGEDEEDIEEGVPTALKLYQNFPNPFNPSTTIAFRLPSEARVSVSIYNMLGQQVATLLENEDFEEGVQTVEFGASNLSSGVYFYRISAENLESGDQILPVVGKMMLLK